MSYPLTETARQWLSFGLQGRPSRTFCRGREHHPCPSLKNHRLRLPLEVLVVTVLSYPLITKGPFAEVLRLESMCRKEFQGCEEALWGNSRLELEERRGLQRTLTVKQDDTCSSNLREMAERSDNLHR